MKKITLICVSLCAFMFAKAQNDPDTTKNSLITLNEAVISANKTPETKKTVAQQVQVLNAKEIEDSHSQSTADLLINAGLPVQKSQLGGGSPIIRGFEASRVLLVVDGVRMNNLIYRAGHLQNIVSTDNNSFERVEILYCLLYTSDAADE